ncbi:hypothetical protein HK101_000449 [Irineochytrium annulatum]|nr:hypothetical protein HK101_000449 [Irineochytrium annulatum]
MRLTLLFATSLLATAYAIPFPQAEFPTAMATTPAAALTTPVADTPVLTPDVSTNTTAPAEASNNATVAAAPEPPEPSLSDAVGGSPTSSAPQSAVEEPAAAPAPEAGPDALDTASGPMDNDEAAQAPDEEGDGEGRPAQERDYDREERPARQRDGDREDVRAFPYDEAAGDMPGSEMAEEESPEMEQASYPARRDEQASPASEEEQASPADDDDASAAAVPDDDNEGAVASTPDHEITAAGQHSHHHHHNRHFRYHRNLRYRSRRRMLLRHRLSRFNLSGKKVRYGSTFYHKKGLLDGEGYGAPAVPGDVTYKKSYYGGVKGRIMRTGSDKTAFKSERRRRYRKMRVHHD